LIEWKLNNDSKENRSPESFQLLKDLYVKWFQKSELTKKRGILNLFQNLLPLIR